MLIHETKHYKQEQAANLQILELLDTDSKRILIVFKEVKASLNNLEGNRKLFLKSDVADLRMK